MRPIVLLFTALAWLGGCATSAEPPSAPEAGRLTLRQALAIPPGAATVRLQYGKIVAFNAVQEHDPFCVFEIETVAPGEQRVNPAGYAITRIVRSVETIAGAPAPRPVRVAFNDDGGPSHIYFKTTFRLRDPVGQARALTCMSNQFAPGIPIMRHLTAAEIRQALGDFITLEYRL